MIDLNTSYNDYDNVTTELNTIISKIIKQGSATDEDILEINTLKQSYGEKLLKVKSDIKEVEGNLTDNKIIQTTSEKINRESIINTLNSDGESALFFYDEETKELFINPKYLQLLGWQIIDNDNNVMLQVDKSTGKLSIDYNVLYNLPTLNGTEVKGDLTIDTQSTNISDSGWQNLELSSGITNKTNTSKYRKIGSEVFLELSVQGVNAARTDIATLPLGYRPSETIYFTGVYGASAANFARFSIDSNGVIKLQNITASSYTSTYLFALNCSFLID